MESEAQAESGAREVGRMVDSSQADDRKMIRLVKERRLLYARNNMPVASYYTRVKGLWREVAQEMSWSVADVRRKWSHIRNSYSRHLRNEMHGARTGKGRMVSRWYLADELEFLREHMATDTRPSHFSTYAPSLLDMDLAEGSKPEPVDIKPFMGSPWFSLGAPGFDHKLDAPAPAPSIAPAPAHANDDSCSSAFEPDENSSYFQFFRGIHVDYQELSTRSQRLFKRKCLELLHGLLDEEEAARAHAYQSDAMNLSSSSLVSDDERDCKLGIVEKVVSYATDQ